MIVNTHAHPFFRDWFPGEEEPSEEHDLPTSWVDTFEQVHDTEFSLPTYKEYWQHVTGAGVDKTVFFLRDMETIDGEPPENEWLVTFARQHDDVIPFFAIDPNKGAQGAASLRTALNEWGMQGAKIHPHWTECFPDDEVAWPIYEAAVDHDIPILFHTGPGPLGTESEYTHPKHFEPILQAFPNIKLILAHFGGPWHEEVQFLAWRYDGVYTDLAFHPRPYIEHLPWEYYEETIQDSILLGSDFPLGDIAERIECLRRLDISEEFTQKILGGNAAELLSL